MKIMGLGMDLAGNLLFPPVDEKAFASTLVASLNQNAAALQLLTKTTVESTSFRAEEERQVRDLGDPKSAGWTFLVNENDPRRKDIQRILKPLALHRGMADPAAPLVYHGEPPEEWFEWLNDNFYDLPLAGKKIPHYLLIAASPDQVPFSFQSILNTVASVGRVAFDTLGDLETYVTKLIRIETAEDPLTTREAVVFAPDGGDVTYYSREYMAQPLAEHIRDYLHLAVQPIMGKDATKEHLLDALCSKKPALVYTASHGLGVFQESEEVQRRYNGALCCQAAGARSPDNLFTADDVPMEMPFLEGAIVFQFACFGYGTPAESDFAHWLNNPRIPSKYCEKDFVAALPKRLLAHPHGPIGFVGHLDMAFLHGFADPDEPMILDRWHNRIEPFIAAVDELLQVQPSGMAMRDMAIRYSTCNALITNTFEREKRGKLVWNDSLKARFLDRWITRSDAQNYMVFGDPAARLRLPKD